MSDSFSLAALCPCSRGILKALKVLAIAHDFLSQHGSTLSFVPSGYEVVEGRLPYEFNEGQAGQVEEEEGLHTKHIFSLTGTWVRKQKLLDA